MGKEWKKTKEIHWSDEINQDFDQTKLKRKPLPANFNYIHKSKLYWLIANIIYYGIIKWILFIYCYLHGIRFTNKKALKELKGKGAFIYANHVAISDCFKYPVYIARRVDAIGYSDAMSVPIIGKIMPMLGLIPLPAKEDRDNFHKMLDGIKFLINDKKRLVLIFPEAHIWPYYTKIRNWKNNSLIYPAMFHSPIIPAVTVWKKRKFRKKPRQIVIFGTPIYPKEDESITYNKDYLHQECIKQMKEIASSNEQQKYIKYIQDN